jgi:rubrerythrin
MSTRKNGFTVALAILGIFFCVYQGIAIAGSKSDKSHSVIKSSPQREVKNIKPAPEFPIEKYEKYVSVLESSNEQLGASMNRFGAMFSLLSLLVTLLLGIVGTGVVAAAVLIFRQEREYFRGVVSGAISSLRANHNQVSDYLKKTDQVISSLKAEMKASSHEQKERLQNALNKMESARVSLSKLVASVPSSNGIKVAHKCSQCGSHSEYPSSPEFSAEGEIPVQCPKCNHVDIVKVAA